MKNGMAKVEERNGRVERHEAKRSESISSNNH